MNRLFRSLRSAVGKRLDGESKILIRNSTWVFIANLNAAACDFSRSIVLGRGLGVENFGMYMLVTSLVMTIKEFFNLNLGTAFIKFGAEYKSADDTKKLVALLKLSMILAAVSAVISILLIAAVNNFAYDVFISQPGLQLYIQFYAVAACLSFFDFISISLLKLYFKFRLNSLVKIVLDILDLAVIGATVYLFPGQLTVLIIAAAGTLFMKTAIYNGVALWEMRDIILPHMNVRLASIRNDWRRLGNFVISNSASRTLHTLIFTGDILLLGALAGPAQVGYYAVAKKLAFAILRVTDPLSISIYPQLANLISIHNYRGAYQMLGKITRMLVAPIGLLLVIAFFISGWLITRIYGVDYQSATLPFMILLIASSLSALFFWSTPIILSLGRINLRLKTHVVALSVGLLTGFLLGPSYGATGVAIALCLAVIILHSVFVRATIRELR